MKKTSYTLLVIGALLLFLQFSSGIVNATVTNGNVQYYFEENSSSASGSESTQEGSVSSTRGNSESTESSGTTSSSENSTTSASSETSVSSSTEGSHSTASSPEQSADGRNQVPFSSDSSSRGSGEETFLKTNDTINRPLIVTGVVLVIIAVYILKTNYSRRRKQ